MNDTSPGTILASEFRAAGWLKNRHAQTIYASMPWIRAPRPQLTRQFLELPDGDVTAVDWVLPTSPVDEETPMLLILHGLEGSSESAYARMLLHAAAEKGWRAGVLHFRDCGEQRNRLPRRYHAGETADLTFLLTSLENNTEYRGPIMAAGFSLGGNVLLKYLGERGARSPLKAAVAVSVPLDLRDSAHALNTGFSKSYQYYLLKRMKLSVAGKFNKDTAAFDWQRTMNANSFEEFDDAITAPLHGFTGADQYYDRCSARGFLAGIRLPTLIINSLDDPFMTPAAVPAATALPPEVQLELSSGGGHVGFIDGGLPWRPTFYLPARITSFLHSKIAVSQT